MGADIPLCHHNNNANTCTECEDEGAAARQKVRDGKEDCPICGKNCTVEILQLQELLTWLLNLHNGVSKDGGKPTDEEWRDVLEQVEEILPETKITDPRDEWPMREMIGIQEIKGNTAHLITLECGHKIATREQQIRYPCSQCNIDRILKESRNE
jgi:hypothetical protein